MKLGTDLPIADQVKLIYKDQFLIVEASNADQIYFNYEPDRTSIFLKNSNETQAVVGIASDIEKQTKGFVVEARSSAQKTSTACFCVKKGKRLQGLRFVCEGNIGLRSLNSDEKEQIELLKTKHANDRKFFDFQWIEIFNLRMVKQLGVLIFNSNSLETLGPFKLVHDVQKTGLSPTIRFEAAKLKEINLAHIKDSDGETQFTVSVTEPGSNDTIDRFLVITSEVKKSSFVIEDLPKGDQQNSCFTTDLPYTVTSCTGSIRIRKIRESD